MSKPALVVVWEKWENIESGFDGLVPDVFSRLVRGRSVEDFTEELDRDDKVVLCLGSSGSFGVLKAFMEKCPQRVPWVHSLMTGVDALRPAETIKFIGDVPITNSRGAFSLLLAEHVIFSMFYFNRRLTLLHANKANQVWDRHPNAQMQGQKLGIVGYGDIAKHCAKLAMAMGVEVIAYKRDAPSTPTRDTLGASIVGGEDGLRQVLSTTDFVLAVLPATESTKLFFNAERIGMMQKNTVFINIGRGVTVDEPALINALNTNAIKGAAIDVFTNEPLPKDDPWWAVDNSKLLLTPHNADISDSVFIEAAVQFSGYAKRFVASGEIPEYRVDLTRGY